MGVAFVAEVSSNHHRSLSRCYQFIDQAADLGCEAVKFQLFKVRELFAPEVLERSEEHRRREAWELPIEFLPKLAARCEEAGVQFACTPFYLGAVQELLPYVAFYKIASYELLWDDLLAVCARTGKPVVLSTGMATEPEVAHAVEVLRGTGCSDLTLLRCVSHYPAPAEECNLSAIESLRDTHGCPVGWSDHTVSPAVILRAIHRWGASLIEFHLDLRGEGEEYGAGHCWLPEEIRPVIQWAKAGFSADGEGRVGPAPSERKEREWRADPSDGLRPLLRTRSRQRK